jgi:hypothetical protein
MKTSIVVLYVMVSLSLALSLTAVILIATDNNSLAPSLGPESTPDSIYTAQPTKTPSPTNKLTPVPTASNVEVTVSYVESSRQEVTSDTTKVTLTVTATIDQGDTITINYSQFRLQLYTTRMIVLVIRGTVDPQNSGSVTLSPSKPTQDFQLIFEFPTTSFNGMDEGYTCYEFQYTGPATIHLDPRIHY